MRTVTSEITRARIEAKIEELIAFLDLVDGDENLEPYLADTDGTMVGSADDREDDGDDLEPDSDAEPTFAWQNEGNQEHLSNGSFFGDEIEPEFGWCGNAVGWTEEQGSMDSEPNGDELDTCFTEDEWHVRFGQ